MSQICSKCQHVNPAEAVYCYFDGALLQQDTAKGGPVNPGTVPFPTPFVFPTGQTCQNFDQLAMACQNNWDSARDLLQQGFFAGFLGGLGRADLAKIAQEAAAFPDKERGLDQLLSKLPSKVLDAPKLKVTPSQVNLGMVHMGSDRQFELTLENQGMRLLYGTMVANAKWLAFDAAGQKEKLFEFRDELSVPVHVLGNKLRSGPKALTGELFIESNSGKTLAVTVKMEVPVKPFPAGSGLAAAKSPREVAVKAREAPKDAAALFEDGSVERWFKDNGWIYPVQGPPGSGLGAVQQFFEALGLAKAPKVTIDTQKLTLKGKPGEQLKAKIKVETPERRPVYAHAHADEAWLDVSKTKIEDKGRIVQIYVFVPSVPLRPGITLTANIRIAANGNQRFGVPVTLAVEGTSGITLPPVAATPPVMAVPANQPVMAIPAAPTTPVPPPSELPPPIKAIPAIPAFPAAETIKAVPATPPEPAAATMKINPADQTIKVLPNDQSTLKGDSLPLPLSTPTPPANNDAIVPMPASAPANNDSPFGSFAVGSAPARQQAGSYTPAARKTGRGKIPVFVHIVPMLLLLVALFVTLIKDLFAPSEARTDQLEAPLDRKPRITILFDYPLPAFKGKPIMNQVGTSMRFGIQTIPKDGNPGNAVRLTYDGLGRTNNTRIKVGNTLVTYGLQGQGQWIGKPQIVGKYGTSYKTTWKYAFDEIHISQIVKRVPGDPFLEDGQYKRALDTCLVLYEIDNREPDPKRVGLRMLIDTFIGSNDGVPFSIPGIGLVKDKKDLGGDGTLPDFLQVLERSSLKNPGTVVQLNLKLGGAVQPPDRVRLTRWPGHKGAKALDAWSIPLVDLRNPGGGQAGNDSAIVLYWDPVEIPAGGKRLLGFSYGLGHISSETGKLSLNASTGRKVNDIVTILARVSDPKVKHITLTLPSGLSLLSDNPAKQTVPALPKGVVGRPREVTWRARADQTGNFDIRAETNTGDSQTTRVLIRAKAGILGS